MKKILVTGITGFVGTHLTDLLRGDPSWQVHGTSISSDSEEDNIRIHKINLLDEEYVKTLVSDVKPDYLIHLAALSSAGKSFDNPKEFLQNNTDAQINVLEGIRKAELTTRTLIISSGEIYGQQKELPIDENALPNPTSPYAVSKINQDFLALQYCNVYNMDIIRARPFNHIGPGQSDDFVVSAFAKQIAEIEKIGEGKVKVGNLEAKRDFTDVRDMVKAYMLLLEKGKGGDVYNIGKGESVKIQTILDMLLKMSIKEIEVEKDPNRIRPIDVPDIVADASKIKHTTGWNTEIPLEKTLQDTLDYWREII